MAKGYPIDEIKQKLVKLLASEKIGLSGVDISKSLGINRITMRKYLGIFDAQGVISHRSVGNVTLWFIDDDIQQYVFPDDYFKASQKYLDYLLHADKPHIEKLLKNCARSNADGATFIIEVIMPAIDSVEKLYNDGKIGNSEISYLHHVISDSLTILGETPSGVINKNVIVLSADDSSVLNAKCAASAYRCKNWNVVFLGNMSESINVIFDLDIQKLLRKVWKKRQGVMIVVVFSSTLNGFKFFAQSINAVNTKSNKNLKLVLCGDISKQTKIKADLITEKLDSVMQWSQTVSESQK